MTGKRNKSSSSLQLLLERQSKQLLFICGRAELRAYKCSLWWELSCVGWACTPAVRSVARCAAGLASQQPNGPSHPKGSKRWRGQQLEPNFHWMHNSGHFCLCVIVFICLQMVLFFNQNLHGKCESVKTSVCTWVWKWKKSHMRNTVVIVSRHNMWGMWPDVVDCEELEQLSGSPEAIRGFLGH